MVSLSPPLGLISGLANARSLLNFQARIIAETETTQFPLGNVNAASVRNLHRALPNQFQQLLSLFELCLLQLHTGNTPSPRLDDDGLPVAQLLDDEVLLEAAWSPVDLDLNLSSVEVFVSSNVFSSQLNNVVVLRSISELSQLKLHLPQKVVTAYVIVVKDRKIEFRTTVCRVNLKLLVVNWIQIAPLDTRLKAGAVARHNHVGIGRI